MTSKFEEKLYEAGQKIALTFDEREALRARLLTQIDRSSRPTLSPYSPMFYWRHISVYVKPQYVSLALLLVLITGGISVAAEKALPGQPLYQVKTSVNENVLALFAFTPQSKAQLHTYLAVRRLEEVETLAINGTLSASTTASAETSINGNLAVIKNSVAQLASENNNTAAADTSSKAESSLKVHEAILNTISDGNASINASVKDMAINVGIQATALSLDQAAIDSKVSSTTLSTDELMSQQKSARDAIAIIQAAIATSTIDASTTATSTVPLTDDLFDTTTDATSTTAATTTATATSTSDLASTTEIVTATATATSTADLITAQVQDKLQQATDFLTEGNSKLDNKDYGEAFILFKKAEKAALEGQLLLQPSSTLDVLDSTDTNATSTATSTSPTSSIATSSPSA